MTTLVLLGRLVLAAVFAAAGLAKLADRRGSEQAVVDFGVPFRFAPALGLLLPLAELAVAVALLPAASAWLGAAGALVLLLAFIAGIGFNLSRGKTPDCHCFGQIHSEPIGRGTLARNGVLLLVAVGVMIEALTQPGPSAVAWVGTLSTGEQIGLVVGVLMLLALAGQGWLILQLLNQQGRVLLRLDALEGAGIPGAGQASAQAADAPAGLPVGSPAPSFTLSDPSGRDVSLSALLQHGRPVALLFTDPLCGPCTALLPEVGRWQFNYPDSLTLALVSRGDPIENRDKAAEHAIANVLIQADREVADAFGVRGTPSVVIVHPNGTIASAVTPGADNIRALITRSVGMPTAPPLQLREYAPTVAPRSRPTNGHAPVPGPQVGTPAPVLSLPDLDGSLVDLTNFRGSETAVLFWNPGCGFCQQMLPDLKAWEAGRQQGAPRLLVVSGGSVEANRQQGIRSPVVLDQGSAVARSFGAHGTPMAVLVDDKGAIASEMAAGSPAVLSLLQGRAAAGV